MANTYSEFANQTASEKITLVHLHMKRQVRLFTDAGSNIYTRNPAYWPVGIQVDGTIFTETTGTPVANQWRYTPATNLLEVNSTTTLGAREVIIEYRLFLSNAPTAAAYNLQTGGVEVEYLPVVQEVPGFQTALAFANENSALIGTGSLQLDNSDRFFTDLLNEYRFENKSFTAYSWTRNLPYSERKIVYSGFVTQGRLGQDNISFSIKDTIFSLNNLIPSTQFTSAQVIDRHAARFNKRIFGRVNNMAVQSTSQIGAGYTLTGTVSGAETSVNINGVGTLFLSEVAPGDKININGQTLTVKEVVDNGFLTVAEELSTLFNNISVTVSPQEPWYNNNRVFAVAEHPLKRFTTTIVSFLDNSRLQVASTADFLVGDKVFILNEAYTVSSITNTPTLSNILELDRTLSLNNFPSIGETVLKREVQSVNIAGSIILDTDYSITNADNTPSSITLSNTAEQNLAAEFFTPSDLTVVGGTEYMIVGTPAINTQSFSGVTNYLGTSINISNDMMLNRFIWFSELGSVVRTFTTDQASNVSFSRGETYMNSDDNTNYGFRADTDGTTQMGTVGQVDIGSEPIIVSLTQATIGDDAHASEQLKRAMEGENIVQKLGYTEDSGNVVWLFLTNQGLSTSVANVVVIPNVTPVSVFTVGATPQLDYDFSEFLKPRDIIRVPTLSTTEFQILNASSKFLRTTASTGGTLGALTVGVGVYKNPSYVSDTSLVTVSAFGQTEDDTIAGTWIKTPTDAVRKVLTDNGLGSLIDTASFDNSTLADFTIGLYTPYSLTSTPPTVIDFINKATVSTLGSIGLNNDFQIKFQLLNGAKPADLETIRIIDNNESIGVVREVLDPSSLFRYTVSNIDTSYDFGEDDPNNLFLRVTDATASRLTDLNTTQALDIYLTNLSEVTILSNRYLAYNQRLNRKVSFLGPLSLENVEIGQLVLIQFLELENFIGMVTELTRNGSQIALTVENFGGLFETAGIYTANDVPIYTSSTTTQQLLNTYYTDSLGLLNNDENTLGDSVYV